MYFTSRAHLLSFNVEIKIKKFRKGMYVISWINPPPPLRVINRDIFITPPYPLEPQVIGGRPRCYRKMRRS